MMHLRDPPLQPDITTYNIIIRSGTILRRNDISDQALDALRQLKQNAQHAINVQPSPPISLFTAPGCSDEPASPSVSVERWPSPHQQSPMQRLDIPRPNSAVLADAHTLTSYILHLTSTGQPHIVADVLFNVLPELSIIDHPSWGSATEEERKEMRRQSRKQRLLRAVSLGPHFFTAVLNALGKAGKTGLAERVWLLAKEAERVSWVPQLLPDVKPWCLPVHAYTIMLQRYGAEAHQALRIRRAKLDDTARPELANGEQTEWAPRLNAKVRGWAQFITTRRRVNPASRRRRAMTLSSNLFRTMFSAAKDVYGELLNLEQKGFESVQIPRPDARFFNAALSLYGRQPGKNARSSVCSRAHWRQKLRVANSWYARLGMRPRRWNPFLARVVEEMVKAGYPIPAGFRHLFVGHQPLGFMQFANRPQLNKQPFAFPRMRSPPFRPHALATLKTRGLPIKRTNRYTWKKRRRKTPRE
ncbi:hypothetical protein SERLA73DRAFT_176730 [Serpula lacrymans var. lacrymans S7.3]|uniref:Uncharacterized protein n=2 Tax=Serpula lacrymans var. lacrymans TaxID=341189 RepID=F8PPU0_SERL3|nr:uncharacterized protein SERLADRAFT_459971 [Serpula lacrymans var. lacrymans S7.9]EGO01457.1 hypothetical protein SERLA73DRAFT_176730 [Serpula lacrymans var. lacrymans S7.3]EGO27120.1 hypothetical protein SERLADRAFT_459971 [Serpula lacrymans var. lacrymans S7.9]